MNIQFDTRDLKAQEAAAVVAFLSALYPTSANAIAPQASLPVNEEEAIFGVPAQPAPGLVQPTTGPVPVEPPKRTRRTKEQIAADEAAAKAVPTSAAAGTAEQKAAAESAKTTVANPSDPTLASAAANAAASDTTQSALAQPSTADAKPLSAEELRALLNGYIAKHSMEDAIGKLKAFGCNRVTEALSLEPAKLNELAEALRG